MCHSLDASNIHEFPIKWQRGKGVDPTLCPSHEAYLTDMCERVSLCLEGHISEAADTVNMQCSNSVYQEVLTHNYHCRELYQTYMVQSTHRNINVIKTWVHTMLDIGKDTVALICSNVVNRIVQRYLSKSSLTCLDHQFTH